MKLPKDFESYFSERWSRADVEALLQGLDSEPSVSIRLNPRRLPLDIEPEGADGRVPWCPEGSYLRERPQFTADPLLHAGVYYVQEASSMFLSHVLRAVVMPRWSKSTLNSQLSARPRSARSDAPHLENGTLDPSRTLNCQFALDLCAAPGGKSTLLRSLLPDDCLLVSNEPLRARAQVLAENLAKWGHPNVLVTQTYARDITKALRGKRHFDLILADVPCSGEGMMRKEEEAVRQWSPSFVAECAALQRTIVEDIWPALRPGGILIYSTCTFNPEEDEDNVEWIASDLGATILPIPVDPSWHIKGAMQSPHQLSTLNSQLSTAHFLPGQVRGEGFFCAVLQKDGEAEQHAKTDDFIASLSKLPTLPTDQLDAPDAPRVELSLDDAVRYLQREALVLPADTPRGIVQVCFHGQRLGLVKNLGTRANNLYPKEWRIRSSFITPHTLF